MGRSRIRRTCWPAIAAGFAVLVGTSACSDLGTAFDQGEPVAVQAQPTSYELLKSVTQNPGGVAPAGSVSASPPRLADVEPASGSDPPSLAGDQDRRLPWLTPGSAKPVPRVSLPRPTGPVWDRPEPTDQGASIKVASEPGQAPVEAASAAPGDVAVHLASYESREAAISGWTALRKLYPRALGDAEPMLEDGAIGAKGRTVRLLAGPFDTGAARSVCRDIMTQGGWCRQVSMSQ